MTQKPLRRPRLPNLAASLWLLLALCLLPELVLSGADLGLWGAPSWRGIAYAWAGFWPGLLHDWAPNYPGQVWVMFVTYGFLHAGIVHLLVNMMSLVSLGRAVTDRVGQGGFWGIYGLALLGGGLGFGLLSQAPNPMVGASGALFGLAGALILWGFVDRCRAGQGLWPIGRALLWLVALNLILWAATGGRLAWQTHLGGFLAGAVAAAGVEAWQDRRAG